MSKLTYFYLPSCPHCRLASRYLEELCAEDGCYKGVEIERIDESAEKALAAKYDYWYVPCFYVEKSKLHEGHAELADIRRVFEQVAGKDGVC